MEKLRSCLKARSQPLERQRGSPAVFTPKYYAYRNPIIQQCVARVRSGQPLAEALRGFPGTEIDERVVEYPAVSKWLLDGEPGLDLLDVGCVLNNRIISNLVMEWCDRLWFVNPAAEPLELFSTRVFYHLSPLAECFSHGERFPLVTCISTIEHIGYDNSHYGSDQPAQYCEPALEPWIESLEKIASLVATNGRCFVTVPFGKRELVRHPVTGRHSSQVFDSFAIKAGIEALERSGIQAGFEVYAATGSGWEPTNPDTFDGRYAWETPAAASVAIVKGQRR